MSQNLLRYWGGAPIEEVGRTESRLNAPDHGHLLRTMVLGRVMLRSCCGRLCDIPHDSSWMALLFVSTPIALMQRSLLSSIIRVLRNPGSLCVVFQQLIYLMIVIDLQARTNNYLFQAECRPR